jgi:phosphatidylinositol kinase/protein kinase (PI-3  family)
MTKLVKSRRWRGHGAHQQSSPHSPISSLMFSFSLVFFSQIRRRTQNFLISSAAYCVASYVLGLGDRHNDNLMMTISGHFFHIDFGHILGNFKYKMGVKRERAPFVFTYAMKAVMRDDQYEEFVNLCCDVYNSLRENAMLLVSLVSLAIPCNLPELREEKDVMWLYEKLKVGASDEEAAAHFREQLAKSLKTTGTRLNDAAHMLVHA